MKILGKLIGLINHAVNALQEKNNGKYEIINDIHYDF